PPARRGTARSRDGLQVTIVLIAMELRRAPADRAANFAPFLGILHSLSRRGAELVLRLTKQTILSFAVFARCLAHSPGSGCDRARAASSAATSSHWTSERRGF